MFAASYFDPAGPPPDDAALLDNLAPTGATLDDLPYGSFLERIDPIVELLKTVGAWSLPHPWFDVFMPDPTVEQFLGEVLSPLTTADRQCQRAPLSAAKEQVQETPPARAGA